jgi:hypothetical protein
VAWQLYDPSGSTPAAEPQVADVTSAANTTAPPKQDSPSEPATTPRTEPATVPAPKTEPATVLAPKEKEPTSVPATTPEQPAATLVGPPPPQTTNPKNPPKVTPPAFAYWLARKPDPARQEYIFDTRVPADLAAMIACTEPPYARFQGGIQKRDWLWKGMKLVLLNNRLSWKGDDIERGQIGLASQGGRNDNPVSITDPDWNACKEQLLAQAVASGDQKTVAVIMVKVDGTAKPDLRVKLDDAPTAGFSPKPHIVAVAQKNQLYVCWQTETKGSTPKIRVHKIAMDQLEQGNLSAVRDVESLGTLVGFTVDEAGSDYVLTTKTENFPNNVVGGFVNDIHKTWRKDVVLLYRNGKATDLNSEQFASHPFYGVTNFGTGRLAVSSTHLAAIFSRREYTPSDNLIHQIASDLVVARNNPSQVAIKAGNVVSHSFSQRLILDGNDFITLHAGDSYPYAGLIVEKLGKRARFNAYSCPTNGNSLFFDLGGVAAEADGYPILFTSTRNTASVNAGSMAQLSRLPSELALVYVVRNFETKRAANPYDMVGAGILAGGYAPDEEFTVENAAWNPASSRFDGKETRKIRRRVLWLTEHDQPGGVSNAKLVKLRDGQYTALWTEGRGTQAMRLAIKGPASAKSITKGDPVELRGVLLPLGDDAVSLRINGAPHAAWITSNGQILLHTLDVDLAYKVYPLNLP